MQNISNFLNNYERDYDSDELVVTECGRENCLAGKYNPPMKRSVYVLHYVTNGSGAFVCDSKTYYPTRGEIFLIKPGSEVEYYPDRNTPWTYFWVGLKGKVVAELVKRSGFDKPVIKVAGIEELFEKIVDDYNTKGVLTYTGLGYVYMIFDRIISSNKNRISKKTTVKEAHLREAISFLRFNHKEDITIKDLANSLMLSPTYIINIFTEILGVSPRQYLISVRLERALGLMMQGYSLKDTYALVGYKSPEQLSKSFKQVYGISPIQYVRENKKKAFRQANSHLYDGGPKDD